MSDDPKDELKDIQDELTDERFQLPSQRAIRAAYRGDQNELESLLDSGYQVDKIDRLTGMAALHMAVGRNDLAMVKFLVEKGASFFPDRHGRWPSTIASLCEVSEELCDFIAEAEARVESV